MQTNEQAPAISHARQTFPCGLVQTPGAYRFGLDALLLAAWTAKKLPARSACTVAELGTGCGAALLGLALLRHDVQGLGIEKEYEHVIAAEQNIAALDLTTSLTVLQGDITEKACLSAVGQGHYNAVMANPPWRATGSGRASPRHLRRSALTFTPEQGFAAMSHDHAQAENPQQSMATPLTFAHAAYTLLRHHGHYYTIFAASGLSQMLNALTAARLGLRHLLCVHPYPEMPAHVILLEARKDAHDTVQIEPPLYLFSDKDAALCKDYTVEARGFCPWLNI